MAENNKDRLEHGKPDKREVPEPHRLLQDKPEGSRETIERELARQEEKGGASGPNQRSS